MAEASGTTAPKSDRRGDDRRASQESFTGEDRRTGERRTVADRRAKARLKLNH